MQKITQRNTWDLKLIDHLSALVQGDDDEDDQTNFQKASSSHLQFHFVLCNDFEMRVENAFLTFSSRALGCW